MADRAVIYCRVSTKEQTQNLSLPTQLKFCQDYCRINDYLVDATFVEEGESAKTINRTEFQRLISYCQKNKGRIQFVVVYSLNRFARDSHDHHAVRAILAACGVRLRSVTEPIDDSSVGRLVEGMLASIAQFDNDVRSERTTAGMKESLEAGWWPFRSPLGYLKGDKRRGEPPLIPDPERAPLVLMAFALFSAGTYQKQEVLRRVTDLGLRTRTGKKVSPQAFDQLLRKSIYAGWLEVKEWGIHKRGDFQAIVSQEVFDRVQAVLTGRRPAVTAYLRNHPDFPLRQFVRCGSCGRSLTASWSKGRSERYPYYRCHNAECRVNVRKEVIEKLFLEHIRRLKPKQEYLRLFLEVVGDVWRKKLAEVKAAERQFQGRLESLQRLKDNLVEAFVSKKLIDEETYQEQLKRVNDRLHALRLDREPMLVGLDLADVLEFAEQVVLNADRMWANASINQKQRLQKVIFPDGVRFSKGSFGTEGTRCLFYDLSPSEAGEVSLASRTGLEPVLPP